MPLNIDDKRQRVFKKRIKTHGASWPSREGLQYCFEKYMGFIEPWNKEPNPNWTPTIIQGGKSEK